MPNPPKIAPQRGHRGRGVVKLPVEGWKGTPPDWPAGRATAAEMRVWVELWRTPQAAAWERLGQGAVREVARYCRLLVRCEKPSTPASWHAQATALADRLGLTPKAMRLLLWEVASDEIADQRVEPTDVRNRIKAV
jgi:hypothetical protein